MISKAPIKLFILLVFILFGVSTNAQNNLLQNTINKLVNYRNFSYDYVYKQKEVFGDTLILYQTFALLKVPEDKQIGYFFRKDLKSNNTKTQSIDLYNGDSLISLYPGDSTYSTDRKQAMSFSGSLLKQLNWINNFSKKDTSKLIKSADTVVNSINSYHLILNTKDTIINKEHLYTRKHLFIDKATGLPVAILTKARTADFGKEAVDYYVQESYFNFKIEQKNINADYFSVPKGFKPYKRQEVALLTPGTLAPDWTLYNTEGKRTSLSQLKGKVILLDFFFIGCTGCMQTLAPLDKLYEKYRNKNLVILSISERDNKQLVTAFKKSQRIKNQMFPDGGNVTKLYHTTVFPTFYLIDQEGKIADVVTGYSDGFANKIAALIDNISK